MKKKDKRTFEPKAYDRKYYTKFLRQHEDFANAGVVSGYPIVQSLLAPKAGDKILDIGCGRGEIVKECNVQGAYTVGMDYSQDAVKIAKQNGNKHIVRAGAIHLPFANETFDKILLMEVIEHLDEGDVNACLQEIKRILKKDGYLVLTTPNSWNKVLLFLVKLFNLVGIKIKWMSREDPYHINLLNPVQLRQLLRKHGFRVKLFPKIKYSPETPISARLKQRLLFPVKHLRCVAYK